MPTADARIIAPSIDIDRYPLTAPDSAGWASVVTRIRGELAEQGCSVLTDFIRPERFEALRGEGARAAPSAYYDVETVNVYNTELDPAWPSDHPGRRTMRRGNAFVARDQLDPAAIIVQLYASPLFQRFVADCFGLPRLFELADPLSGLVLNVVKPGREHPWHFDTNEFTVSMLTQEPESGGVFEYCPNIRSAQDEHLDDVRAVLAGQGDRLIRPLTLRPGDLQLFRGRYALHRVSQVRGDTARHSAIFAYSERPGVIGSVARTRQLFGRVGPEHLAAQGRVRVDQLLD
jgi:hypothetical protein